MWIFVEPLDVWLFRDAKPFLAGEQLRATGSFPPLPTTFQGVVRSAGLARGLAAAGATFAGYNQGDARTLDLARRWGTGYAGRPRRDGGSASSEFGRFRMRGPFVALRSAGGVEPRFVAPFDLLSTTPSDHERKEYRCGQLGRLRPGEAVRGLGGGDTTWSDAGDGTPLSLATGTGERVEPVTGSLNPGVLRRYLLGALGDGSAVESDAAPLHRQDLRLRIGRDRISGTAKAGRLFLTQFTALVPGAGLAAEVTFDGEPDGDSGLAETGTLSIGGEARGGYYAKLTGSPLTVIDDPTFRTELVERLRAGDGFKLVLGTPGVFRQGWCPDFVEPRTLNGTLCGVGVRLRGAVVGKPVPVSGWDHAGNAPKPLRWAAPAGSVYSFAVDDSAPTDWPERIVSRAHGQSVAVTPDGTGTFGNEIGMGLAFVGAP